jgi:hypothetical protein
MLEAFGIQRGFKALDVAVERWLHVGDFMSEFFEVDNCSTVA